MENLSENTPVFFQVLVAGLGLAIVLVVMYTLLYVADELEDSPVWPVARFIKALIGGLLWTVVGIGVAVGLFYVSIAVWYLFFRPLFPLYIWRYNAYFVGLAVVCFYLLWGVYHGAANKLRISYRYRRHSAVQLQETG